jgi:hypothetical protein
MDAIYNSANSFKVFNDVTSEFVVGRRVKMDCGLDGVKYASVVSSSYSTPYTTVVIDESDLTASLTDVWYAVITTGPTGSIPDHLHDGSEGHGGVPDIAFIGLTDTPTTYSGSTGLFIRVDSTASGVEFASVPASGIDDHVHAAYVPWDFGTGTISGTGDIYCNDIYTYSGTVYIGDLKLSTDGTNLLVDGNLVEAAIPAFIDLTDTPADYIGTDGYVVVSNGTGLEFQNVTIDSTDLYHGTTVPDSYLGKTYDYYIKIDDNDLYKRSLATYSSNLAPEGTASAQSTLPGGNPSSNLIDGSLSTRWQAGASNSWVWWKDDFGGGNEHAISKVSIYTGNYANTIRHIQIHGSNDNSDWDLLYSINEVSYVNTTWYDYVFVNEQAYRYIRVNFHGQPAKYPALTEVRMYSASAYDWEFIDNIGVTEEYIDTVSGTLQLQIDDQPTTFSGLTDTPDTYDDGYYLRMTASGITTVSGIVLEAPNGSEWLLQVTNSGTLYTTEVI